MGEFRFVNRWLVRRSLRAGGPHPLATLRFFLSLFSPPRQSGDATFLIKRKWPKTVAALGFFVRELCFVNRKSVPRSLFLPRRVFA